jgi:hypothetical protein
MPKLRCSRRTTVETERETLSAEGLADFQRSFRVHRRDAYDTLDLATCMTLRQSEKYHRRPACVPIPVRAIRLSLFLLGKARPILHIRKFPKERMANIAIPSFEAKKLARSRH